MENEHARNALKFKSWQGTHRAKLYDMLTV